MKNNLWNKDWFAGLLIALFFLAATYVVPSAWLQGLERTVYDIGVRMSQRTPGEQVAVVAIDDQSIKRFGRWPWSREVIAEMIDRLTEGGAKVIGLTVLYSEPQIDPGLQLIRELKQDYAGLPQPDPRFAGRLEQAERALDADQRLAAAMERAGNVILPMEFVPGEPLGNPDAPIPDYVGRFALENIDDPLGMGVLPPQQTIAAVPPVEQLGRPARGIGHLVNLLDVDGSIRSEALVLGHYGRWFPSQALLIAAASLNLGVDDIRVRLGDSVDLGRLHIKTDPLLRMQTFFYGEQDGRPPFEVDSFYDVASGNIPAEIYKGRIVLIGPTAFGLGTSLVTPVDEATAPVLIMAHNVASILNEDFFTAPSWAPLLEFLVLLAVAAYLIGLLPRLKAGLAAGLSAALLIALLGTELALMKTQAMWLQLVTAATLLFVGHLLITTKRFLVTEAGKLRSDVESAESNKMLGLAYQQQGQLDMAFEKFRRVPLDDAMMDNLYTIALDYERKRQFNKANNVYQYMARYNPKFRDLEQRMNRAKAMEDTVLLGSGGASAAGTMILGDGSVAKPMLGRYEVEKELGKGAMGVVYLGRDPKINRVVAIKTMALSQEFEADELDEVKARFFREAETAGRLHHPNIVTIYDAGEEHDLAYIAMEFLEGHDLTGYTKTDKLLPLPLVMGIIYKSALALEYAHKQNVVHRDIKPANIMFDPKAKQVKLTDFGIARITDSSKTKTGMVLGTPSYMSPEQLSGKKVDGRSDLFSLGVTLYQLATGKLPFQGDSMATLMYKIANEPHPNLLSVKPELAKTRPCLAAIIDKALDKDIEKRYQSGGELARDLQRCAKQPASG